MKTQYITNEKGKISAVIVPKKEYDKMIAMSEEFEDIQLFNKAVDKIKKAKSSLFLLKRY